jgi:hypothetical protein
MNRQNTRMAERPSEMGDMIEELFGRWDFTRRPAVLNLIEDFRTALDCGPIGAAARNEGGIFLTARMSKMAEGQAGVFDFDTLELRQLRACHQVRDPGSASVFRGGGHLAPEVVSMPPVAVNSGSGTVVDSLAVIIEDSASVLTGRYDSCTLSGAPLPETPCRQA